MRYRQSNSGGSDEKAFIPLDSQLSDRERFKDANPFLIQCRSCKGQLNFSPINDREVSFCSSTPVYVSQHRCHQYSIVQPSGLICPACTAPFALASIEIQLEVQIRETIGRYYEGWTVCDDPTCRHRTRMMSVYGRRCLKQGCKGTVAFEVSGSSPHPVLRTRELNLFSFLNKVYG
jgi:DNA polymerase alpha subunit A